MVFIPFCSLPGSLTWMRFEIALVAALAPSMALPITFPTPGMKETTLDAIFCAVEMILRPNLATTAPVVLIKCPTFFAAAMDVDQRDGSSAKHEIRNVGAYQS
jgi:hypothetical protein